MSAPPAPAHARRSLAAQVVVPAVVAAVVAWLAWAFLRAFLQDEQTLVVGIVAAWAFYAIGRGVLHWDVPKGGGAALQRLIAGSAVGLLGLTFLLAAFEDGPGWPLTPWWALAAGAGIGMWRASKPLVNTAREREDAGRAWGVFDRRELLALGVLLGGYALAGVAFHRLFLAFSGVIPESGKALAIGAAVYALYGAKLLLAFASHDAKASGRGFLAWFKANLLRNAIVALVLVAYAVYRDDLARNVPFFPLVEFGLGIALFSFVLARLRSRIKRESTDAATASEATPHRQRADPIPDPEYDAVAAPIARFIETGRGQREYLDTLRHASGLPHERADALLEPVARHREPPPAPVLPMSAEAQSAGVTILFAACAAFAFFHAMLGVEPLDAFTLALLLVGVGVYFTQVIPRRHHQPWLAVGVAAAGAVFCALVFLAAVERADSVSSLPGIAWRILGVVLLVAIGIPALIAWRHERRARQELPHAPREAPHVEIERGLRKARTRVVLTAGVAFGALVVVPPLARWAAARPWGMEGFPEFYGSLMKVAVWIFLAVGAGALTRFAGLSRARAHVLAEERRRRALRLNLHAEAMRTLERV